jgi:hypothetical protein
MIPAKPDRSEDFDLDMEILACLPRWPHGARMQDLARDFGLKGQGTIRQSFQALAAKGIEVRVFHGDRGPGNRAAIMRQDWKKARKLANGYWKKVYGR